MVDLIAKIIIWIAALTLALLCLIIALRCFGKESLHVFKRELRLERQTDLTGERFTWKMGLSAIGWGVLVIAMFFLFSAIHCATFKDNFSWADLRQTWMHWDAPHYRDLAEMGYRNYTEDEHLFLVFFPLYPWTVHLLSKLIPNVDLCGHLLSSVAFIASCYMMSRLVTEEFGRPAAVLSLALLSVYPFAFFYASFYTESLFLFLSLTTFYFIRRHRYLLVGIFGALAALTRMHGLVLGAVALVEWWVSEQPIAKLRARDVRGLGRDVLRLLCIALIATGTLVYLWLNYEVEGNPFQFTIYQREHWSMEFAPLTRCLETIWSYILRKYPAKIAFTTWMPEFALFFFCTGAAVYGTRRLPPAWMTYFLLLLVMNYSLSWPLSCGRYIATAFPLPVILAVACRKRPMLARLLVVCSAILLGAFFQAYLSGSPVY